MTSAEASATPLPVAPADFEEFAATDGLRLARALVAAYGEQDGADLHGEAMARAWQNWERVGAMDNPAGYLWVCAKSDHRRYRRWKRRPPFPGRVADAESLSEWSASDRELLLSLGALSEEERVSVLMVHAHKASYQEVADLLGVPVTSVTNFVHRGLKRLRTSLGEA
jgi:RNA polymerase sigma factor (sigma-70 family)